jgi:hypothetical protein
VNEEQVRRGFEFGKRGFDVGSDRFGGGFAAWRGQRDEWAVKVSEVMVRDIPPETMIVSIDYRELSVVGLDPLLLVTQTSPLFISALSIAPWVSASVP